MSPQLSQQQIGAAIKAFENRLNSKKLECDALGRLRKVAPNVIPLQLVNMEGYGDTASGVAHACEDYLTAKINWLLIDIQEYELQIKMLKSQQSGIVSPGMIIGKG